MSPRVLIAGLFHETNTFLGGRTHLEDFQLLRGSEMLATAGDSSPLAGVVEAARDFRWQPLPVIDLRAMPGAVVEDRVVELFWQEFERAATKNPDPDGVFLVLHGAMVSESVHDVEGEILARVRGLYPKPRTVICGVLDLHANVTQAMADHADCLVAYRENPHTDAKSAAVIAAGILDRLMCSGERPTTVWSHARLVWPPTGTATLAEPMRSLESAARAAERAHSSLLAVNVLAGFAFADTTDTGVSFSAVTRGDGGTARQVVDSLCAKAWASRELGNALDQPANDVLRWLGPSPQGPVILAEPSDNIGAGASGRGVGALRALLEHGIRNAAVVINAPEEVARLSQLAVGAAATIKLGASFDTPLELDVELLSLSDGRFTLEDPQSHLASLFGSRIEMGSCATVRHQGLMILLTSRKTPPFDLGQLRSQGIEPEKMSVIVVKAAVAHRRAYDPIARASFSIDTPGPCCSNLKTLPYRRVRRPIFPLDA